MPTITKRIGSGGDYATFALFLTDLKANYTQQADYIASIIGGVFAGGTVAAGDIVGGASGSTLTIVADTANTATANQLLQADTSGAAIFRSNLSFSGDLVATSFRGIILGSSTANATTTLVSTNSTLGFSVTNSFIRVRNSNANPLVLFGGNDSGTDFGGNGGPPGTVTVSNVGIIANNSVGATQFMIQCDNTQNVHDGNYFYNLQNVSCHTAGAPGGFLRLNIMDNHNTTVTMTSVLANNTSGTLKPVGTITVSGTGGTSQRYVTLNLIGAGCRFGNGNGTLTSGSLDLSGVSGSLTGVTLIINQTWSDCTFGDNSSSFFADASLGLNILPNASTITAAITSPVSADINGAPIPTTNGTRSAVVWAGFVNAAIPALSTLTETWSIASTNAVLTFTSTQSIDHFALVVDAGNTETTPVTSPSTVTGSRGGAHTYTVRGYNDGAIVIAQSSITAAAGGGILFIPQL